MRKYEMWTRSVIAVLLLICAASFAQATTYNISYTLAGSGKVSMNIYDSNGKIVRELLHAVARNAGANMEIWDGLDNYGNAVAAGTYSWKLLRTPSGLSAQFLADVGSNHVQPGLLHPPFESLPPTDHSGVEDVAVDASGVYMAGQGAEAVPGLVKESSDGTMRYWGVDGDLGGAGGPLATDGTSIFSIESNNLVKRDCATGDSTWGGPTGNPTQGGYQYIWPESYLGVVPNRIAVNGTNLVVIYTSGNKIQWIDPNSGAVLDSAAITAPMGVSINSAGTVFLTSGSSIVTVTRANHTPVNFVTGLTSPTVVDVDNSNGDVLVFCAGTLPGTVQHVLRYDSTGTTLKNTYGQLGGRVDGLYTTTMQQSFLNITDLRADGSGGFYIAEPYSAPRRVTHFSNMGAVLHEWYGGQQWAPWLCPEPTDPTEVWIESDWGYIMRCKENYSNNTFTVQATYKIEGLGSVLAGDGGIIHQRNNGAVWKVYNHAGTTFLAKQWDGGQPLCILKVDPSYSQLIPVSVGVTDIAYAPPGSVDSTPQSIINWAVALGYSPTSFGFQWTDAPDSLHPNGDGVPQQSEVTFYADTGPNYAQSFDAGLNAYMISGTVANTVSTYQAAWNPAGNPTYSSFPNGVATASMPTTRAWGTSRSPWFFHDTTTGNLYSATNSQEFNWGQVADAYMIKWNPDGTEAWEAGMGGGDHEDHPTGKIGEFRSIVGTTHGCIAALDFNGMDEFDPGTAGVEAPVPSSYVWDQDGLFVGGMFDSIDLVHARFENYRLGSEMLQGSFYTDPGTGAVYFYGTSENQGDVYSITGWDNWERQNGPLTVTVPSTGSTGQGLRGDYYNSVNFTNLVSSRLDPTVNFNWGTSPPSGTSLPAGNHYSVRWTGTVTMPNYGPVYSDMSVTYVPQLYDGSAHVTADAGASCSYTFHGTSVKWVSYTGTVFGTADVYVDGVHQSTQANFYTPTTEWQQVVYTVTGLTNADHTIKMVDTGNGYIAADCWILDGGVIDDDAGEPFTFYTNAADGARLWIDDNLLINDPTDKSLPAQQSTVLTLPLGTHTVRLDYYDDADPSTIALSWSSPNVTKQIIPTANLYPATDFVMPRDVNNAVPGIIEVENYDEGGEGVGYHHVNTEPTALYAPWKYRGDLDTELTANINFWWPYDMGVSYNQRGNYEVQCLAGEWTKYTVNVTQTGVYTISVNVSAGTIDNTGAGQLSGGAFHVEIDGTTVGSELVVPPGTGAAPFSLVTEGGISLTAGQHVVRLVFDSNPAFIGYQSMGNFDYIQFTTPAAAPTFSPAAGTYTGTTAVTMSSTTTGASFAYTTDGSTPTESGGTVTNGTLYSGPVNITATSTLKAIAFSTNYSASGVTSGLYAIKAVAPTYSPAAGTYTTSTSETISSTTTGASFAYTTDGTTPTESGGTVTHGTLYTAPVNITGTTTLKAIAFEVGLTDSTVTSGTFTIKAATPTFSPVAGTFTTSISETISSTTPGVSFAYTTDGTTPTESGGTVTHGTLYTAAVNITSTTTLKAIAFKVGITDSAVASGTFTIKAATPTYTPVAGTYTSSASVTIASTTPGVSFAYTTDASTPTESGGTVTHGTLYTGAVSITATTTLKAIAFKVGITDSAVASGVFTIQAAPPTFGTAAGMYAAPVTTTLATATGGASIAYTTDGSTPTASGGTITHGTLYSGAITLAIGLSTVKAIAFKVGLTNSAVASAAYTVFTTVGVGSPGVAGSITASGGVLTVNGAGTSDSGLSDQLQFCYLPMSGNCTLIARMTGLSGPPSSEAGVTIRGVLTATAATEALTVTNGAGTYFIHRAASGGNAVFVNGPNISGSSDEYFKLVRSGSTVTIYASTTTSNWGTAVGTATITFGTTVYLGFEIISTDNVDLATATYDNVTVTSP